MVSHVDHDRLVLLALGEQPAGPAETDHLDGCEACRSELVDLRSLVAVGRDTHELRDLPEPPAALWDRIAAQALGATAAGPPAAGLRDAGAPSGGTGGTRPGGTDRGASGPGGAGRGGVPSGPGRRPGVAGRSRPEPRPARRGLRLALVAFVAAALGVLGTIAASDILRRPAAAPAERVVANAELAPLPDAPGRAGGDARIVDTGHGRELRLTVHGMPAPRGFYEIWLYDPRGGSMVSMGNLGPTGSAALPVPASIDLGRYTIVDVSAEELNGDPAHGQSMLRGTLAD